MSQNTSGHFELCVARWPEDSRSATVRRKLTVKPTRLFKATALLVWGATEKTVLHRLTVAGERELEGPILLQAYYQARLPFEEFERLLVPRPDDHPMLPSLAAIGDWGDIYLSAVTLGTEITIDVEGSFEHALFIGKAPRYMTVGQLIAEGRHGRGRS